MGYIESLMGREEQIVFATRQHWVLVVSQLLGYGILTLLIVAGSWMLYQRTDQRILLLLPVVALPMLGQFLVNFLNWWKREFIVTTRRVIQTEGILNKRVSDSSLEKVNDVVLVQSALGRLLDYGDVEIITGSDIGVNNFRHIAQPVALKTAMLNAKEGLHELGSFQRQARQVLTSENAASVMDIPVLLANLADLRDRGVISDEEFERKKAQLLERI
jgi:uncharacterized membrane protein YdbT with pleckstrin-like domain